MKSETVLAIFTFSPVQSFISEARRAEDLFNGSAILSRLAYAAAQSVGAANLIYPVAIRKDDMPNKLVARLPADEAETILTKARDALIGEWHNIAADARQSAGLDSDEDWMSIWQRQVIQNPPWQVFWACQPETGNYTADYREVSRRLDAVKHTRLFAQSEEDGEKDSLSGQRSALRTASKSPKTYWAEMVKEKRITASQVKPEGRERLDGIGLVKRFAELREGRQFPSTSTIAGWDFYMQATKNAKEELAAYRQELTNLKLYRARGFDSEFPYDLDLLFKETLTTKRMEESYGIKLTEKELVPAKNRLNILVKKVGFEPSPYYAILLLDGDGIGKKLDKMKGDSENGEAFHHRFSERLAKFAQRTAELVEPSQGGFLVYNGGDDVLLLTSLQTAIRLARELAATYEKAFDGLIKATLSGAVLIAHHLSPLSRALTDLRRAERYAKGVNKDELGNKDTLCVALAKRGGEPLLARSGWNLLEGFEEDWVAAFRDGKLANSLPYLLREDLRVAEELEDDATRALVCYRFKRQAGEGFKQEAGSLAERWLDWTKSMEGKLSAPSKSEPKEVRRKAFEEAVNWLVIARFLGQGGKE